MNEEQHESLKRWLAESRRRRVLWTHNGDKAQPHIVSSRGEHQEAFFDRVRVGENPIFLRLGAWNLVELLKVRGFDPLSVDRVLGSGKGSPKLANDVAHVISVGRSNGRDSTVCCSACLEGFHRIGEHRTDLGFSRIMRRERILVVADLFSLQEMTATFETVRIAEAVSLPFVGVLANLSGSRAVATEVGKSAPVVALIDHPSKASTLSFCSLCEQGSPAAPPPTSEADWKRLMKY